MGSRGQRGTEKKWGLTPLARATALEPMTHVSTRGQTPFFLCPPLSPRPHFPPAEVHCAAMLNMERRRQFLDLMAESGWDVLLLYGHSWRKDFFRSLVNFNFFGPHAVAALTKANELSIVFSHP